MDSAVEMLDERPRPISPPNDAVLSTVAQTEAIGRFVPLGIIALLCVLPALASLFQGRMGMAFLNAILGFIIAGFVIRIVNKLVLQPMQKRPVQDGGQDPCWPNAGSAGAGRAMVLVVDLCAWGARDHSTRPYRDRRPINRLHPSLAVAGSDR